MSIYQHKPIDQRKVKHRDDQDGAGAERGAVERDADAGIEEPQAEQQRARQVDASRHAKQAGDEADRDQRETNIEFLRDLPDGAGDRVALHREFGEITLAQMLNEWALHDLGHIRQVAELVRARKYHAGAGAMAASYHLKP